MSSEKENFYRGGRPKQAINKDKIIGVRFTGEEYEVVKGKAKEAGMKLSKLLRLSALNISLKSRVTAEEKEAIRQLTGMAVNLNQLAHKGHVEGFTFALAAFGQYEEKIKFILQKFDP